MRVRIYQPCLECNGDGFNNTNERREVTFDEIAVIDAHYRSLIQAHKEEIQRLKQYVDNLPRRLPKPSAGTAVYRDLGRGPILPTVDRLLDV